MKRRGKRRFFPVVDRSLQYRFLAMVVAYSAIIAGLLALFLFVPDILTLVDESQSLEIRAAAANKILTMHARVWPAIVALICLFGLHSLRIFHRLFGPLYRFRQAFKEIGEGNLGVRVKLRKNDYLRQEEEAFNEMVSSLGEKWGALQVAALDALETLGDIEEATSELSGWQRSDMELLNKHRQRLQSVVEATRSISLHRGEPDEGD